MYVRRAAAFWGRVARWGVLALCLLNTEVLSLPLPFEDREPETESTGA